MSKTADADRGAGERKIEIDGEKRRENTGAQKSRIPAKFMRGAFCPWGRKSRGRGATGFFCAKTDNERRE